MTDNKKPEHDDISELLTEAFIKIAQIIIQARYPFTSQQLFKEPTKPNMWFSIKMLEYSFLSAEVKPWLKNQFQMPLYIPIFWKPSNFNEKDILIEQWRITYQPSKNSGKGMTNLYQHFVILIRALYNYLRVLPAYNLFRTANKKKLENLQYKFEETDQIEKLENLDHLTFTYKFTPVETPNGVLHIDVVSSSQQFLRNLIEKQTQPWIIIVDDYKKGAHQGESITPPEGSSFALDDENTKNNSNYNYNSSLPASSPPMPWQLTASSSFFPSTSPLGIESVERRRFSTFFVSPDSSPEEHTEGVLTDLLRSGLENPPKALERLKSGEFQRISSADFPSRSSTGASGLEATRPARSPSSPSSSSAATTTTATASSTSTTSGIPSTTSGIPQELFVEPSQNLNLNSTLSDSENFKFYSANSVPVIPVLTVKKPDSSVEDTGQFDIEI